MVVVFGFGGGLMEKMVNFGKWEEGEGDGAYGGGVGGIGFGGGEIRGNLKEMVVMDFEGEEGGDDGVYKIGGERNKGR